METTANVMNWHIQHGVYSHQPHPQEHATKSLSAASMLPHWSHWQHTCRQPLAYVDVYLDDFISLAQMPELATKVWCTAIHTIN